MGYYLTQNEKNLIIMYLRQGKSYTVISSLTGRSRDTVKRIANALKVQ